MEIERINENTVKFYVSYYDIEDLGFEKEEIWYNRERSEELFWQMMEEVNYKEDFNIEGPLWIQVQALEKGLEIIVTKAKMSKNGDSLEVQPDEKGNGMDSDNIGKDQNLLENKSYKKQHTPKHNEVIDDDSMWMIVVLDDFENVIQLSHYINEYTESDKETLYHYDGKYYLYLEYPTEMLNEDLQEDDISQVLEFANDSNMSIYLLEEYGKMIFENDTFDHVRKYFPAQV